MLVGRVLCLLVVVSAVLADEDVDVRTVSTAQGPVRGRRAPDGDLFVFYNIPYATAPTGNDRFKAPLPRPTWTSPLDATVNQNIVCPQYTAMNAGQTVQEDCLIANIYVPDTAETNLSVVVSVHGGAYQSGFGNMATLRNLVRSERTIAVNINYRLGVHGFLCLGTPDAPGNAGMKDQVAALRWVNNNIAYFGGNPNDVTIHGSSAGSSSVDLLMLSKSTEGLFHRVIPESGANVGTWSVQIDPLANAKEYALTLGFNNVDDIYALEDFYKTASFELLASINIINRRDNDFVFTPCVERDTGVERFLDDYPLNILRNGDYKKVPMLYGFADMEGLYRMQLGAEHFDMVLNGMNKKFSDFLPRDLRFESEEEKERVAEEVKQFYFGDREIGEETLLQFIDYNSDIFFSVPTLRSLNLQVEAGNDQIYLYEYSFYNDSMLQEIPGFPDFEARGAGHCAQSMAVADGIFGQSDEDNIPQDLANMKAIMRELWLNFITTGEPVPAGSDLPSWPAAGVNYSPHMALTLPPQLRGELLLERTRFWDDIYERHFRAPVPPPTPPPPQQTESFGTSLNFQSEKMSTIILFLGLHAFIYFQH